jgi:hypothetical protein
MVDRDGPRETRRAAARPIRMMAPYSAMDKCEPTGAGSTHRDRRLALSAAVIPFGFFQEKRLHEESF